MKLSLILWVCLGLIGSTAFAQPPKQPNVNTPLNTSVVTPNANLDKNSGRSYTGHSSNVNETKKIYRSKKLRIHRNGHDNRIYPPPGLSSHNDN